MGKSLSFSANAAGVGVANGNSNNLTGGSVVSDATEAVVQFKVPVAGTLSRLAVNLNTIGTTRSFKSRVNGANGAQTLTVADASSGVQEDASNTDDISADDLINARYTDAGANPTVYGYRAVFQADSGHVALRSGGMGGGWTVSGATRYVPFLGGAPAANGTTTIANAQSKIRVAGTISRFQLYVGSNARAVTDTFRVNINGTNGNGVLSVTSGATGLFEDTTNTDAVADGDLVCVQVVTGVSASSISLNRIGAAITSAAGTKSDLFFHLSTNGLARAASATVHYLPIAGQTNSAAITTESQAQMSHGFVGAITKLRIYLSANTYAADATLRLRKNGVDGNNTVTLTAGLTGWFEDATSSDDFDHDDLIALSVVGGTSGSITVHGGGVTEEDNTLAVVVGRGLLDSPKLHRLSLVR